MTALPSTLALSTPADGTTLIASRDRNNYTAIQTAVNQIISCLSGGTAGQVLRALSSSSVGWDNTPFITSSALSGGPPGSPVDGQVWIATAAGSNGEIWAFRYNSGSGSSFKWEFLGGSAIKSNVDTDENTGTAPYIDLATAQSITLSRAGDYDVHFGCAVYTVTTPSTLNVAITKSGVTQFDASVIVTANNVEIDASRRRIYTAAASDVLKMQYGTNGGAGAHFLKRWFCVTPVRIS